MYETVGIGIRENIDYDLGTSIQIISYCDKNSSTPRALIGHYALPKSSRFVLPEPHPKGFFLTFTVQAYSNKVNGLIDDFSRPTDFEHDIIIVVVPALKGN